MIGVKASWQVSMQLGSAGVTLALVDASLSGHGISGGASERPTSLTGGLRFVFY